MPLLYRKFARLLTTEVGIKSDPILKQDYILMKIPAAYRITKKETRTVLKELETLKRMRRRTQRVIEIKI